jgi:hypothetical protein
MSTAPDWVQKCTKDHIVWQEDDATMHQEGHETIYEAIVRLYGFRPTLTSKSVGTNNYHDAEDSFWYRLGEWLVICQGYDGGNIYYFGPSAESIAHKTTIRQLNAKIQGAVNILMVKVP